MTDIVDETAAAADVPGEPVLEVRDLRVWYGTDARRRSGPSTASASTSHAGETLGLVGESGLRQVDPGPRPDRACCPRARSATASCCFQRRATCCRCSRRSSYAMRGARARDDLPGAADPAEPADADLASTSRRRSSTHEPDLSQGRDPATARSRCCG